MKVAIVGAGAAGIAAAIDAAAAGLDVTLIVGLFLFGVVDPQSRLGAGSGFGREGVSFNYFTHRAGLGPRSQSLSQSCTGG